jgi:methylenetetrahydrofolate reductase (NADPH)
MRPDQPISELFSLGRPLRSFEFFPAKDEAGWETLRATAAALKPLAPDFVSVTYGAGGTTRERTARACALLRGEFGFTVMQHFTCVGHSRAELAAIADRLHADGLRNIMTLRGDPPRGQTAFTPPPDGLGYANELVALLKARHPGFCLGVAAYPEKHPEAPSPEADLANLKRKVDAGAAFVTTQLFFDNAVYHRFVQSCRAAGIIVPIVPGIMPVLSLRQIQSFATMCGTALPTELRAQLETTGDDAAAAESVGIEWARGQIRDLLAHGAPGIHLYVLNRSKAALALANDMAIAYASA